MQYMERLAVGTDIAEGCRKRKNASWRSSKNEYEKFDNGSEEWSWWLRAGVEN